MIYSTKSRLESLVHPARILTLPYGPEGKPATPDNVELVSIDGLAKTGGYLERSPGGKLALLVPWYGSEAAQFTENITFTCDPLPPINWTTMASDL